MSVSVKKRIETFGAWCSGYVYLTDELQQERNASWVRYRQVFTFLNPVHRSLHNTLCGDATAM